jgi:hypothetical protein
MVEVREEHQVAGTLLPLGENQQKVIEQEIIKELIH